MANMYSNMKLRLSSRLKVPWLSTSTKKKSGEPNSGTNGAAGTANGTNKGPNLQKIPQPRWTRFEGANPWTPDEHVVLYCMNNQDNVPARMKLDNDFVYYISQSRSPGHKDQGQDCMATASHNDWELHILCDGHDKLGHMVALGVCQQLPRIILRMIHERNASNTGQDPNEPISDKLINAAFDECSRVVCWTSEGITVGIWVKVFDGQWADKPGYIKESSSAGKVRVAIIDENGYHLPPIDRKQLRRPRYTGGCTCVCLIRNKVTKECKIAVSGDSRILILPSMGINDAVLMRQPGVAPDDDVDNGAGESSTKNSTVPEGLVTPAHNVFNLDERERLQRDYAGQYEFDGNFLVNPITKFAIQPTRGFGDFDMFGTGYTHCPEITKTFKMEPNSLIYAASDGVFDTHVWQDEEIVSCLDKYVEEGLTNTQIVENMYRETLQRSLEGGYVDDISMFCFKEPPVEQNVDTSKPAKDKIKRVRSVEEELNDEMEMPSEVQARKNVRDKRRTIGRGGSSYTDLSAQMIELKKKRLQLERKLSEKEAEEEIEKELEAETTVDEKLEDIVKEDDADAQKTVEDLGSLLKNMATHKKLQEYENVPAKEFVTGRSFSQVEGDGELLDTLEKAAEEPAEADDNVEKEADKQE